MSQVLYKQAPSTLSGTFIHRNKVQEGAGNFSPEQFSKSHYTVTLWKTLEETQPHGFWQIVRFQESETFRRHLACMDIKAYSYRFFRTVLIHE